jgi:hypothetical protein
MSVLSFLTDTASNAVLSSTEQSSNPDRAAFRQRCNQATLSLRLLNAGHDFAALDG